MVMFCFLTPVCEEDKKLYELLQQETSAPVVYLSKWLMHGHIFQSGYFFYVSFEAKHQGMLSLDVLIVQIGNIGRHMGALVVIKYEPCVNNSKWLIKRDTTGCRFTFASQCKHFRMPGWEYLRGLLQDVYHYLYREGFSKDPNYDFVYHMRELCDRYDTLVSKYLIEQFIRTMTLLYKNTEIMYYNCECNAADDYCICKPITDRFCVKKNKKIFDLFMSCLVHVLFAMGEYLESLFARQHNQLRDVEQRYVDKHKNKIVNRITHIVDCEAYTLLRPINAWLLLALPTLDLICPRELRTRLLIITTRTMCEEIKS